MFCVYLVMLTYQGFEEHLELYITRYILNFVVLCLL